MIHAKNTFQSIAFFGALVPIVISGAALAEDGSGAKSSSSQRAVLEEVTVTADRTGSFSADFVQAGTFRDTRLMDTSLTIAVVTKDLLNAQQALSIYDAARNAGATISASNNQIYSNLRIRGLQVSPYTNYRMNGILPIINLIDMPMQNKERVEVLKGASGLYYGFATPAGVVNLTTERPTGTPITSIDVFGNSHGTIGGGFDVSRNWGNSGLRVNAAGSKLADGIERTWGNSHFISAAYDWAPMDKLSFELDGEYIYKTITELPNYTLPAAVNGVIALPPLRDPTKNIGGDWFQAEGPEYNLMAKARYSFSPAWELTLSGGQSVVIATRRYPSFTNYDLTTGDGTLTLSTTPRTKYDSVMFRGDLAGAFLTGPIKHEVVIGVSEVTRRSYIPSPTRRSYAQNLYNPVDIPEEPTPQRIILNPSEATDFAYYALDRASYNEWLQLTIGYRKTDYKDISLTSAYEVSPGSFSYALLIKPKDWISLYASYIEGLESGGIAQQIAVNAGEILPVARSTQKEAGIKMTPFGDLLLTAAYFEVDHASSYLNSDNYFVQDGRAVYKGVEFSATGEIAKGFSISLNAILLDAVQEQGAAAIIGKRIENAAKFTGSIFAMYRWPLIDGLSFSAGAVHIGKRPVNTANEAFVPGYTIYDVGASYDTEISNRRVTFRVNGENVTGERYWASTGSRLVAQGLPALIKFTVSTSF